MATTTPTAPPAAAPPLTNSSFHPDSPGPLGWLIFSLHTRLAAVEAKLNLPSVPDVLGTVETATKSVVSTVETDLESAMHKIEEALHITPHTPATPATTPVAAPATTPKT